MKGLKVLLIVATGFLLLSSCATTSRRVADVPVFDGVMHTVQKGETLVAIAKTYEVTPQLVQRVNSIRNPDRLNVGTRLFIPTAETVLAVDTQSVESEKEIVQPDGLYHLVAPGETLSAIAKAYGEYDVSIQELQQVNSIPDASTIQAGERIWIPRAEEVKDVEIETVTIVMADTSQKSAPPQKQKEEKKIPQKTTPAKEDTQKTTETKNKVEKKESPKGKVVKTDDPRVEKKMVPPPQKKETKGNGEKTQAEDFPRKVKEYGPERFQWPIKSSFKVLRGFNTSSADRNPGVDLGTEIGTPVCAAADGRVIYVGDVNDDLGNFLGNFIILFHGERNNKGIRTVYGHHSENLVQEGQQVKRGQQIARVGNTGSPEVQDKGVLHFEIRELDKPLNPMKVLPALD